MVTRTLCWALPTVQSFTTALPEPEGASAPRP